MSSLKDYFKAIFVKEVTVTKEVIKEVTKEVIKEVPVSPLESYVAATDKDLLKIYKRTKHTLNDVTFELYTIVDGSENVPKTEYLDLYVMADSRECIVGEIDTHGPMSMAKVLNTIIASKDTPFTKKVEMVKVPLFAYAENITYIRKLSKI